MEEKNKGGRPKGSKSARYVSTHAMLKAVHDALGCSYQEALGELLSDLRTQWEEALADGSTRNCKYPDIMMALGNKLIASVTLEPEEADIESLSDEELSALAAEKAKAYLESLN